MRNQYGIFKKDKLYELFLEGQNAGLRLLKSFIHIMNDINLLDSFIQERLLYIKGKETRIVQRRNKKN